MKIPISIPSELEALLEKCMEIMDSNFPMAISDIIERYQIGKTVGSALITSAIKMGNVQLLEMFHNKYQFPDEWVRLDSIKTAVTSNDLNIINFYLTNGQIDTVRLSKMVNIASIDLNHLKLFELTHQAGSTVYEMDLNRMIDHNNGEMLDIYMHKKNLQEDMLVKAIYKAGQLGFDHALRSLLTAYNGTDDSKRRVLVNSLNTVMKTDEPKTLSVLLSFNAPLNHQDFHAIYEGIATKSMNTLTVAFNHLSAEDINHIETNPECTRWLTNLSDEKKQLWEVLKVNHQLNWLLKAVEQSPEKETLLLPCNSL
ncbi:MAG: hypothetical protein HAW67_06500 [Endozoicomonadaceae bacterium]|nr:hypothetical protein [Endozoicomonadaceae bacterium]